jgi:hypothetical protein
MVFFQGSGLAAFFLRKGALRYHPYPMARQMACGQGLVYNSFS